MRRLLLALPPLFASATSVAQTAPPPYVTLNFYRVSTSAGAGTVPNGSKVCVLTTDANDKPMGFRIGAGSGQTAASIEQADCGIVTNGAMAPLQVVNSAATSPENACLRVSVQTSNGVEARRIKCFQTGTRASLASSGGWCARDDDGGITCNVDSFPINGMPIAQVLVGGVGPVGATGCVVGQSCASVVMRASDTDQEVVQAAGTNLKVNTLNQTFTVNGDGNVDNRAKVQAAVNACPTDKTCNINLANVVIGGVGVDVPLGSDFNFQGTGTLSCVSAGNNCFHRSLTSGASLHRVYFSNFHFVKANAGAVIADIMQFSSAGNQGMTLTNNTFTLSGNAIGYMPEGTMYNTLMGNTFTSPFGPLGPSCCYPDRSGVAIQPQSIVSAYGPQIGSVVANHFNYLNALRPVDSSITASLFEGWLFTANHFLIAPVKVFRGNEINFVNNEFSGSTVRLAGANSSVTANYFDVGVSPNVNILTLYDFIHGTVTGNTFVVNSANSNGVVFQDPDNPGRGTETTNVTFTSNQLTGNTNQSTNGGSAIVFNDPRARNILVDDINLRLWYTGFDLKAPIDRITIGRFEARDLGRYGAGFATNAGSYVKAPGLYQTFKMHAAGTLDSTLTGSAAPRSFGDTFIPYPSEMMPGALPSMTVDYCGDGTQGVPSGTNGTSASLVSSAQGSWYVRLGSQPQTPAGMNFCDVQITWNGQPYVGPR